MRRIHTAHCDRLRSKHAVARVDVEDPALSGTLLLAPVDARVKEVADRRVDAADDHDAERDLELVRENETCPPKTGPAEMSFDSKEDKCPEDRNFRSR